MNENITTARPADFVDVQLRFRKISRPIKNDELGNYSGGEGILWSGGADDFSNFASQFSGEFEDKVTEKSEGVFDERVVLDHLLRVCEDRHQTTDLEGNFEELTFALMDFDDFVEWLDNARGDNAARLEVFARSAVSPDGGVDLWKHVHGRFLVN